MPKKFTHEEFLQKLWEKNEHYRNGEFEVVSVYQNYTTPIIVKDNKGICKIDYGSLVDRNYKPGITTATDKTEYFKKELIELNSHYKNGSFEVVGEYRGRLNKIKISNKYGICSVSAESLLNGSEPTIISAIDKEEYFSEMLKEKNFKIWKKVKVVKYVNFSKVCVDTVYGKMTTSSDSLFEWENLSIKSAENKTDFWVKRCKDLRKDFDLIDYSKTVYVDNKNNVQLMCLKHEYTYYQRPTHHTKGLQGCPYCAKQTIMYNDYNMVAHKDFMEKIEGFTYIIKLSSKHESFYKVGIVSKHRFEYRINQLRKDYKVFVEYKEESDMVSAYNLEQKFLKEFKNYKYIPQIKFKGYTECLTTNPVAEYYHWFNNK